MEITYYLCRIFSKTDNRVGKSCRDFLGFDVRIQRRRKYSAVGFMKMGEGAPADFLHGVNFRPALGGLAPDAAPLVAQEEERWLLSPLTSASRKRWRMVIFVTIDSARRKRWRMMPVVTIDFRSSKATTNVKCCRNWLLLPESDGDAFRCWSKLLFDLIWKWWRIITIVAIDFRSSKAMRMMTVVAIDFRSSKAMENDDFCHHWPYLSQVMENDDCCRHWLPLVKSDGEWRLWCGRHCRQNLCECSES